MAKELLLEIGTEEIPARFIPTVLEEMATSFRELMGQELIAVGDIDTWGTPRRLALVAREVAATQANTETEELGPPKAVAFDAAGKPTPAALGFARKQGVAVADLIEVDTPRGVYLAVKKSTTGRPTAERLPELLPAFILGLSFPKSMRWGSETITFARPIHWILARYGGAVVPFEVGDVTSGGATRGHRFLAPQAVEVADAQAYVAALKAARVIVDPAARRALLSEELARAAAGVQGEVVPNPGLLEENTFLVEYPSVVVGNFEDKFLALPDAVLITSMREHQRYFSLRGADGRLLPHFIAVNNTLTRNPEVVRQGHERVHPGPSFRRHVFLPGGLQNAPEKPGGRLKRRGVPLPAGDLLREDGALPGVGDEPVPAIGPGVGGGGLPRRHPVQSRHHHRNGGGIPQPPGGDGPPVRPVERGAPRSGRGPLHPLSPPACR